MGVRNSLPQFNSLVYECQHLPIITYEYATTASPSKLDVYDSFDKHSPHEILCTCRGNQNLTAVHPRKYVYWTSNICSTIVPSIDGVMAGDYALMALAGVRVA